jgi:hypothetical protein
VSSPDGPLTITATDPESGAVYVAPISPWQMEQAFRLRRMMRRRQTLKRLPMLRRFVAKQPRRPREASGARRRRVDVAAARSGNDRDPDPEPEPHLSPARPGASRRVTGAPAIAIRLAVEERAIAYLDNVNNVGDEQRLSADLVGRNVPHEVLDALLVLFNELIQDEPS